MYTRVAAWATSATPLPMWGVEGSGMVLLPNMVTDFRDMSNAPPVFAENVEDIGPPPIDPRDSQYAVEWLQSAPY